LVLNKINFVVTLLAFHPML